MFFDDINLLIKMITRKKLSDNEYWLIFVASGSQKDTVKICEYLNLRRIDFAGVILPALIKENQVYYHGFIALKLSLKIPPMIFTELDERKVNARLKKELTDRVLQLPASAFLFVDGYLFGIEGFLNATFARYSRTLQFSGCGTGIQNSHIPSVFSNDGFFKNAAMLLIPERNLSVSLRHGYKRLAEPVLVTKSHKNILQELNYQNAFRVYRNLLKDNFSILIYSNRYYDVAQEYPLGVYNSTVEDRVREIVAVTEKGEIILSGEISENQYMGLLHGEPYDFYRAADQTVIDAAAGTPDIELIVFFDCIMRSNKIKGNFRKEADRAFNIALDLISPERFIGGLTIGQIINGESDNLYYYKNTVSTTVIF